MSRRTTLCIVNVSGQDITSIHVSNVAGFEQQSSAPDQHLNGKKIPNNDSVICHVDLKDEGVGSYTMQLTLADGTNVTFTDFQSRALEKRVSLIPHTGSAKHVTVWQSSGGNVDKQHRGTNGIYIRGPQPDHSGWMQALLARKPNVRLNDLVMPGSHDAGVYVASQSGNLGGGKEWARAQSLTIEGQLNAGSRYFDLRVYQKIGAGDPYLFGHFTNESETLGSYGGRLDDALREVKFFLNNNPSRKETVILKFSHTGKLHKNGHSGLARYIVEKLGDKVYTATDPKTNLAIIKLSELAGKAILIFDYEFKDAWDVTKGIFAHVDWPNKDPGLQILDKYANTVEIDKLTPDQLLKLANHGGFGQPYLFNLSWTLTGTVGVVLDLEVLAAMANPWLPATLRNIDRDGMKRPNIVFLDFVEPYLCGTIIALNRLTEIRQFHAENPWRYYYSQESTNDYGWKPDGPAFYAFATNEPGTTAINLFRAKDRDPDRYCLSEKTANFNEWEYVAPAFYAYLSDQPGTVAINQFRANDGNKWRFEYTEKRQDHAGWTFDRTVFWAYPAKR